MNESMPFVITISRQLGSGGAFVGQQLAKELDISYADREIITESAKKFAVLENELECRDEKTCSFWESFMQYLNVPDIYLPPQTIAPTDHELFRAESEIIQEIAKNRSAVIMGRCGSYILREHKNHISIFLHGDADFRKNRVKDLYKITDDEALNMIAKSDQQRARYHHTFTKREWTDASQYDLSLDTSKLGIEKSIDFIFKYIKATK